MLQFCSFQNKHQINLSSFWLLGVPGGNQQMVEAVETVEETNHVDKYAAFLTVIIQAERPRLQN